jgi:hypothetical protein
MPADGFDLRCPECSDRGTVTWVKSLRGCRLDTRAQSVLQNLRGAGPSREAHVNAVTLSSKDLQLFMGGFNLSDTMVRIVFVHAEGRDHLVVLMESSWTTSSASIGAALLPLDGGSTDYVQMDCDDWMDLKGSILRREDPDGASIRIDLDTKGFRSDLKEKVSYDLRFLGGGLRKQHGFLPLPTHPQGVCRLAIRGGRWQILTPAIPRAE